MSDTEFKERRNFMTANEINALVDRLREQRNLSDAEFKTILETDAYDAALQKAAS